MVSRTDKLGSSNSIDNEKFDGCYSLDFKVRS